MPRLNHLFSLFHYNEQSVHHSLSLPVHTPLATSSNPKHSCSTTPMSAQYRKITEVYLHDWWLIKDGKALAVGGYTLKEGLGQRRFSSAGIAKRRSMTVLETIDGFTIAISGLFNRSQTLENGYSSEVCNHFQIGFPYNWKDYAGGEDEQPSKITGKIMLVVKMTNHKKAKVLKKFNDKNGADSDVLLPSRGGVATRRMTRSTNLRRSGARLKNSVK